MHTTGKFPVVSVAGYLGPTAAWKEFSKTWCARLEYLGLTSFHMTEFLRRKTKPYNVWSDQKYESCIPLLIEVIATYNIQGFSIQVSRDDCEKILSKEVRKAYIKDPYILVFDTAISQILRYMYFKPFDERVMCFFGRTSFNPKARQVYERRRQRDHNGHRLYDEPFFVSDTDFVAVQAADMLASVSRNFARGRIAQRTGQSLEFSMEMVERYLRLLRANTQTTFRTVQASDVRRAQEHLSPFLSKRG